MAHFLHRCTFFAAGLLLAGCTMGPDFHPPAPSTARSIAGALPEQSDGIALSPGADIPAEWWSLFHSASLDELVKDALAHNADLAAAQAGLRVAMENLKAQQGFYYPTVAASANASRNLNSAQLSPTLASSQLLYNLYQTQLSVSWTPDIWGENRRQIEVLQAQADAQHFQLRAAYVALAANVVAAAIQEASLKQQIAILSDLVADQRQILAVAQRQQSLGEISGADVAAQETALAQSLQQLPPLQKQLAQTQDLLMALAGRLPGDGFTQQFDLNTLSAPTSLPVSLPAKLVEQRPDIRVAEEYLHAASAQIGVAEAARLPNLTLSADAGSVATSLNDLFRPGTAFWTIGAGLSQPIFDGGTLYHRSEAAKAAYDQAAAQYRSTLTTAFQNVADVLHAIDLDGSELDSAAAADASAQKSLALVKVQWTTGQSSGLAVINAQIAARQTSLALVQAKAGRIADAAALFQALGGGWWNALDLEIQ